MNIDSLERARFNMVQQQIRPWEVFDRRVLALINEVPRDQFVERAYVGLAYADIEIPLGHGQRMMFPRVEARLLQALDVKPGDKILEIGTGSGYLTACLAKLGGQVISLDIHEDFTAQARTRLDAQDIGNVELITADALAAVIPGGPFDVMAVTGSLPERPDSLKQQLAIGGRLLAVIGEPPAMEACLITRVGEDAWRSEGLFETELTLLKNAPRVERFEF